MDRLKKITMFLLFLNTFIAEAMFRQRVATDKSVDLQVVLKMGVWVATFLFCMMVFRIWGRKLLRIDYIFQVFFLIDILISCFYAPNFAYSIVSAFSLITVLFILMLSSSILNNGEIIRPIIYGCTLVAALSIIVYFIVPSFGRMPEWENGTLVTGKRLTGITGAANAVGYISAMCLIALYYYREYLPKISLTYWIFVAINLIALLMSNSRTALAAMIIAIAFSSLTKPTPARLAALCLSICAAILCAFLVDFDSLFAMLARSGDASEITTGTGRTAIWNAVIALIKERPWFGWGYTAPNTLLPAQSLNIGFVANHAHNAILQIWLSVGFIGVFFFVMMMAIKIFYSFQSKEQLNIALILFLIIDGLTEPIAFQGPATTTTIALATVLALNYRSKDETADRTYQQRLPESAAA